LEEHGVIDKYQKGVFKDLIISGDSAMASALEKYEHGGDMSDIQALIAGSSGRRQSIDLLDGLDLDFLNVKKHFGGSFDGDLFFDELESGGGPDDPFKLPLGYSAEEAPRGPQGLPPAAAPSNRARSSSGQQFNGGGQVDMSEYDAIAASLQSFHPQQGVRSDQTRQYIVLLLHLLLLCLLCCFCCNAMQYNTMLHNITAMYKLIITHL
jgi:hypothetical protein